ncbi:hypothetical protein D0859_15669 [Hortaea werneckii]|uniref:Uncharacterized protein n=1 Tax=Hortaea werneckii TaxID=91943 RepID=A0A3M7I402_HORWE|nr:hypothetical protein D0859_15669 [Hortaea werneckii]
MTSRLSYGSAHEQAMTENRLPSTTVEDISSTTSATRSLNGISSESAGSAVQTNTISIIDTTLRSATKQAPTIATTNSRPTSLGVNALSQTNPSISWGDGITASSYHIPTSTQGETNPGGPAATQEAASTSSPRTSDGEATGGFSQSQKQVTIATTVIASISGLQDPGGVFVIALLIYSIYRRRKGATVSEIVRFRPHQPSTIQLSPRSSSRPGDTNKLNIYREERFSLHSSKHASLASRSKGPKRAAYPAEATQRFHDLNPYVKNQWQTAYPVPSEPITPIREGHTFLIDASPEPSTRRGSEPLAKDPQNVRVQIKRKSDAGSHMAAPSSKAGLTVSVNEASSPSSRTTREADQMSLKTPRTYDTQASYDDDEDEDDANARWSWTNSQAPPTPRIVAPNNRSSLSSSISKLRGIRSWVRGTTTTSTQQQGNYAEGRIDEEAGGGGGGRPGSSGSHHRPILKNQAAVPVLAPAPVATKFPGAKSAGANRSAERLKVSRSGTARRSAANLFRQGGQQRILSPTGGKGADRGQFPPSPTPVSPGVVEEGRGRGEPGGRMGNAIEMAERGKRRR